MNTTEIRRLIIENKMQFAFRQIDSIIVDIEHRNDLHLLWNQYNYWEDQSKKNILSPIEERNRIVFSLFSMLSSMENRKDFYVIEEKISRQYSEIMKLSKNGDLDSFMLWIKLNHEKLFNLIVMYESNEYSTKTDYSFFLSEPVVIHYIKDNNISATYKEFINWFTSLSSEFDKIFTEWAEYQKNKEAYRISIRHNIRLDLKKYYKKLLISGLFVGITTATIGMLFDIDVNIDVNFRSPFDEDDDE